MSSAETAGATYSDDRPSLEEYLSEFRDQILLYIFSLVPDAHAAEDICQRCCIVMWKKFHEYDPARCFLAWGCGIARLEAFNYRRSVVAERLVFKSDVMHLLEDTLSEIESRSHEARLMALRGCIQKLPAVQQSMISRVYADSVPCESIAAELGCSVRTFYNRMYLVRRRLLECIQRSSRFTPRNGYANLTNHEE